MTVLTISGASGHSAIYLDTGMEMLSDLIAGRNAVIVTDENVHAAHGMRFPPVADVIVVPPKESSKTLTVVQQVLRRLVAVELDRHAILVGIGGGMVTDLTGFIGSVFLRGISVGFVATTVLAQVDAAIGGKNGVNLDGYKNLVGIIRQPDFVINDTSALSTLPRCELINGMAEVIKSGLIADERLNALLMTAARDDNPLSAIDLGQVIGMAAQVKVDVVNRDVFEAGERRHLNFGHTLGHAVEKNEQLPHGYAVAVGMCAAARLSHRLGKISSQDVADIEYTIDALGLPLRSKTPVSQAMDAIRRDKKRQSGVIHFVLLEQIGKASVVPIAIDELEEMLDDLY